MIDQMVLLKFSKIAWQRQKHARLQRHSVFEAGKTPEQNKNAKATEHMAKARFIKSVVKSAKEDTPQLPWARGTRRAAFIAKRTTPAALRKSA